MPATETYRFYKGDILPLDIIYSVQRHCNLSNPWWRFCKLDGKPAGNSEEDEEDPMSDTVEILRTVTIRISITYPR